MGGGQFNPLRLGFKVDASGSDSIRGVLENSLDDGVNSGPGEGTHLATDRQQKWGGFIGCRVGRQAFFAPIARELHHELVRGWNNPGFLAFAGHFQPPALFTRLITPAKEAAHAVLRDFGNAQPTQIEQGKQPAQPKIVFTLTTGVTWQGSRQKQRLL